MTEEKGIIGSTKKKQPHKRRGKSFWTKAVNDFDSSPLSLQDFCAEQGLAVSTFHGWRRRLPAAKARSQKSAKSASKVFPQKTAQAVSKPQPQFLPVYMTSPETPLDKSNQGDMLLQSQPLSASSLEPLSDASSGLTLYLNEGHKIFIDKDFHGPTLQRLVNLFLPKESASC